MTTLKRAFVILIFPVLIISFTHCAKMGAITGGPRDTEPPKVVDSDPPNYSVNFKGSRIEVTFDEYITLDNVNQQLIVSPPLENRVDVILKNKTLLIELNNELKDSTTYTLNFGNAIKDNNEGNLLSNYEFVFSTGSSLDSLSVYGRLVDAFDLKPPKEPVSILLYDDLSDSAFLKHSPLYVGKTGEDGYFAMNNLKSDTFHIFALKDLNSNYRFDLPNEEIAFLDTALYLTPEFFSRFIPDTLTADSLATDSLLTDSLSVMPSGPPGKSEGDSVQGIKGLEAAGKILVDLYLFQEESTQQYVTDNSRKEKYLLKFMLNKPVTDSFRIHSLSPPARGWYIPEENARRDTFSLWITDTSVMRMDTIALSLVYTATDSVGNKLPVTDTILFGYREPQKTRKKKTEVSDTVLSLQMNVRNKGTMELNNPLIFTTATPLRSVDTAFIHLFSKEDSLMIPEKYVLTKDSVNIRKAWLTKDWESKMTYQLSLLPGAFTDIYGMTNDTVSMNFTTRDKGYYGILHVDIKGVDCPSLVQLMDSKEKIIREVTVKKDRKVTFDYLQPAEYRVKFIHDCNDNGKWDTGNYIRGIQPEKVEFYNGEINIRSNWELEINQTLGQDRIP